MIITFEQMKKIEADNRIPIIDVRTRQETMDGMILFAVNIPLQELDAALDFDEAAFRQKYHREKFPKQCELVFYCHSGGRSAVACAIALRKGYRAKNYAGSYAEWKSKNS